MKLSNSRSLHHSSRVLIRVVRTHAKQKRRRRQNDELVSSSRLFFYNAGWFYTIASVQFQVPTMCKGQNLHTFSFCSIFTEYRLPRCMLFILHKWLSWRSYCIFLHRHDMIKVTSVKLPAQNLLPLRFFGQDFRMARAFWLASLYHWREYNTAGRKRREVKILKRHLKSHVVSTGP